ncbi:MAG: hypothetical protein M1837_003638 [Sclerophora amabilis]|nr:MAG: hypothetical protein M1837_003638 [Sclerophora amabilis]
MSPLGSGAIASQVVPSVQAMTVKVRELLRQAHEIKPDHAIEPLLLPSDFGPAVENLGVKSIASSDSQTKESHRQAHYAIIETSVRDLFNSFVASTSIHDPSFTQIWNLLDIVSIFSDNEQCEPGLIFWLIEELLDSQTIDGCRRVFDYLESRRERITAKHFKQKSLIILRSCNELLRRLSRAENTVFCGRVFIFLFQSFPLGDKSSVNLRGEYHVENVTTYDDLPVKSIADPGKMEVDSEEKDVIGINEKSQEVVSVDAALEKEPEEGKANNVIASDIKAEQTDQQLDTDTLYPIFWSLQQYFSNPTKIFEASNFADFKGGLESTIKKFKEVQRDTDGRSALMVSEEGKKGTKRKRGESDDDITTGFNPKYLTSRDLFDLEVSDLAFRRHILVQALILLDFLQSLAPKSKAKLGNLHPQNKSVLYQFTLSDEDARWASETRATVAAYLQQGPEGKFYYRMVDTVLSRDKNWVRWKAENCPPIERPPVNLEHMLGAKQGVEKACAPRRLRATPLGSLDLGFLSDAEVAHGLERLKQEQRYFPPNREPDVASAEACRYIVPDITSFEAMIAGDDFDLDLAKSEDERQLAIDAKASKTWRALRIASKSGLNVFDKIDNTAQNLQAIFQPKSDREATKEEQEQEQDNPEFKLEVPSVENGGKEDLKGVGTAVSSLSSTSSSSNVRAPTPSAAIQETVVK